MSLTIQSQEDEQRQLLLTVEVSEDRVKKAMRQAARALAGEVNVPGFRKGKAPYHVIVRRVGEVQLRAEAVEDMVQSVFEEALREIDVIPYAQASLDKMEMEPVVFQFTVPLEPQLTLDESYRDLRKDVEAVEISDEAIAEALELVRLRHQVIESVERPVAQGDVVSVSGKGVLLPATAPEQESSEEETEAAADSLEAEEVVLFDEDETELLMDPEIVFPGTAFVENFIGLSAGEEKAFILEFPVDFDDDELAGRTASFDITVLDVKSRILPELDDELAKQEGSYETLAELRDSLTKNLRTQAESEARNELIEGLIDDLLERATFVFPPAALDLEIDSMIENMKTQMERSGWQWEDYLKIQGFTAETIRDNFREEAQEHLERSRALREFVFAEMLTIEAEDIDAKMEERLESFGDNEDLRNSMRQYYNSGYGANMLSNEILMDKVVARAEAIYKGEAPDLAELKAAAEAADEEE